MPIHSQTIKPRLLTVLATKKNHPQIILTGEWMNTWGFTKQMRLVIYSVGAGLLRAKSERLTARPPTYPFVPGNPKPHIATIGSSYREAPIAKIAGSWVKKSGFSIGDRVSVTKEAEGLMVIRLDTPANRWKESRNLRKRELEQDHALAAIKEYKRKYPSLFEQVANGKKKPTAALPPDIPHSSASQGCIVVDEEYFKYFSSGDHLAEPEAPYLTTKNSTYGT